MPHKYAKDPLAEKEMVNIRYKVIWSYKLVYEVSEEEVSILDLVHTSRDPENIKLVR